jgi:hypothetical protein
MFGGQEQLLRGYLYGKIFHLWIRIRNLLPHQFRLHWSSTPTCAPQFCHLGLHFRHNRNCVRSCVLSFLGSRRWANEEPPTWSDSSITATRITSYCLFVVGAILSVDDTPSQADSACNWMCKGNWKGGNTHACNSLCPHRPSSWLYYFPRW